MSFNTRANNILSNPEITEIPPFLTAKSYGTDNICKLVSAEGTKLLEVAREQPHLLRPIAVLRKTCSKPQFTNKQKIIKEKWEAFLKQLKAPPAAAFVPAPQAAAAPLAPLPAPLAPLPAPLAPQPAPLAPLPAPLAPLPAPLAPQPAAAPEVSGRNTLLEAIKKLEIDVQTLKTHIQSWRDPASAAAGGRRTRKQRRHRKGRNTRSRF